MACDERGMRDRPFPHGIPGITGISIRETGVPGKGARFEMTVPPARPRSPGTPPNEHHAVSSMRRGPATGERLYIPVRLPCRKLR
jgi:hypothetical protein